MARKCHTLQPNPRHREEETQSTKDTQQQEDNESKATSYFFLSPQELEVRSLYHLYSLKTKSSRCHFVVLRNDIVSFWF